MRALFSVTTALVLSLAKISAAQDTREVSEPKITASPMPLKDP
ncbi:MAG: hypothetical protein PW792_08160 [Acidobacteriaceae bacterium]|nr:hypothetical protein [Acidobacteriaceae bacterium]